MHHIDLNLFGSYYLLGKCIFNVRQSNQTVTLKKKTVLSIMKLFNN